MPICPKCNSTKTRAVKPKQGLSEPMLIVYDRMCKDCGHRFTPPMPRWAPFILILLGGSLTAFGVVYLAGFIVSIFVPMNVVWTNGYVFLIGGGVAFLSLGIKALRTGKIKNNFLDELYGNDEEQKHNQGQS
jgi:hypothetical protein